MTFQSKPPQGAKTQGWPDNPSKGSKKDWNPNRVKNGTAITVVPTRQDYEKEGERRLSPTTKSKSADFPFFDMKLSKSYPRRFKIKFNTKKVKFYWREEILSMVEDFGQELPYWGSTLKLECMEIIPAGSVFVKTNN